MFDYVLLFQREGDDFQNIPKLIKQYPETLKISNEEHLHIQALAIPNNLTDPDIYTFNTPSNFCYDYSFRNGPFQAAVIIVSLHFRPLLYIDFLKAIHQSFEAMHSKRPKNNTQKEASNTSEIDSSDLDQNEQDIINKFIFTYTLLISWGSGDDGSLLINYPFTSFEIKPSPDRLYYSPSSDFTFISPTVYFNENPFFKANENDQSIEYRWTDGFPISPLFPYVDALWFMAMQNKGVLIIAPTATSASSAAIAFLSLFDAIQYQEPYLLFTQTNDPRFTVDFLCPKKSDTQDNRAKFRIVATIENSINQMLDEMSIHSSRSDAIAQLNSSFSAIITIKSSHIPETSPMLKKSYVLKTNKLMKKILSLLNLALLSDPYFDILEKPIDEKIFSRYMKDDKDITNIILQMKNMNMPGFNNSLLVNDKDEKSNPISRATSSSNKSATQKSFDNRAPLNDLDEKCMSIQIEFYKNVQRTKSFRQWRAMNEDRDQLRVAFLSMTPKEAVQHIPSEKLSFAYSKVKNLLLLHHRDEHFRIILKKNLAEIKKRVNNQV